MTTTICSGIGQIGPEYGMPATLLSSPRGLGWSRSPERSYERCMFC